MGVQDGGADVQEGGVGGGRRGGGPPDDAVEDRGRHEGAVEEGGVRGHGGWVGGWVGVEEEEEEEKEEEDEEEEEGRKVGWDGIGGWWVGGGVKKVEGLGDEDI